MIGPEFTVSKTTAFGKQNVVLVCQDDSGKEI